MTGFDFLKTASDDSEVAFNSAAWEENDNYKLQFFISVLNWRETGREGNAYVGGVWERICGNVMTALSYVLISFIKPYAPGEQGSYKKDNSFNNQDLFTSKTQNIQ